MVRPKVKICGVMRPEDAAAAAALGADLIGVICNRTARRYSPLARAREIIAAVPKAVTVVAVFGDESADEIRATAETLDVTTVQLNGSQSPADVTSLAGLRVIRAVRVDAETIRDELAKWRDVFAIVLEPAHTGVAGGSGKANDWAVIAELQREGAFDGLPPMIAAGGLAPETVGSVVATIRPYAVDVSSGVEEKVGEKSTEKMKAFIAAATAALSL